MRYVGHHVLSVPHRRLQPYQSPHRPLEGRQSSPFFYSPATRLCAGRPEQALLAGEQSGRWPRDDHDAEIVLPSAAPFKRPDIESVAPARPAAAPHVDGRCLQRFWSMGINGLGGASTRCATISEGEDMSPKRPLGLAIAASALRDARYF